MNSSAELGFDHRYLPGSGPAGDVTLLLLHGTGGDADSLLQLGGTILPGAALLSPTGKVREHSAARFFRRLAEGVFDEADLMRRTDELAQFVRDAAVAYGFNSAGVIAVGYSNGANIGASLLLKQSNVLSGAVLFRAMVPFIPDVTPELSGVPIFLGAGAFDSLIPRELTEQLAQLFRSAQADITLHVEPGGHELTMGDVRAAQRWLVHGRQ